MAIAVSELREELDRIQGISNDEWMGKLEDRKKKELEFHDKARDPAVLEKLKQDQDTYEKLHGNKKYYKIVEEADNEVFGWIDRNAKGKVFLDYACGLGGSAIRAAQAGAELSIGIDISSVTVQEAKERAKKLALNNCIFVQADCENTLLPANSVDMITCNGMLHHLDLSYAFPEMRRILKPGGSIMAQEALDYNPLIKLYRKMTPQMRTEWEKAHILSLKDIRFAERYFEVHNMKFWYITSIFAPKLSMKLLPGLRAIDKFLTKIPGMRLMAWIFTFELRKPTESK